MTLEERRAWIRLVVSVVGYAVYVVLVVGRMDGRPVGEVAYAGTLLWTVGGAIGGAILADIVVGIVVGIVNPRGSQVTDDRDREIGRLGERVGQSFVVIGAVGGMLMAMAGWERFWIANVIYLCFVLSAVLGGVTKVVVYRRSVPRW
ncbi:hypothetical protein [Sphaerisporangium aureirubrum]|uniref:Uncharacterized protein n=1 Tax=Sphaerisporangium aureirubrum TaxID=1544736 RepID=A0ABW1NPP3_9ACTN